MLLKTSPWKTVSLASGFLPTPTENMVPAVSASTKTKKKRKRRLAPYTGRQV